MRALAAILILVCLCGSQALRSQIPRVLNKLLGNSVAIRHILTCSRHLGPAKCLGALSAHRADRALGAFAKKQKTQFNLNEDLEQFDWKRYSNVTDEQLYAHLCTGTQRLLEHRSLVLDLQGYKLQLGSTTNSTLSVDVYKNSEIQTGRGSSKKMKKAFYNIVPFLLLPGLLMSAVLPFVLPALKMMTVAVGVLNNMALSGAVFTLLRNNAFNDKYQHKVIYVNSGYTNDITEKPKDPVHFEKEPAPVHEHPDPYFGETNIYQDGEHIVEHNFDNMEQMPFNSNWIKQYYGKNVHFADDSVKRKDTYKPEPKMK